MLNKMLIHKKKNKVVWIFKINRNRVIIIVYYKKIWKKSGKTWFANFNLGLGIKYVWRRYNFNNVRPKIVPYQMSKISVIL